MYEALIVGLILAVLWALEKLWGTPMVIRPLVVSTVVGIALGNIEIGLLTGATLELVFMGAIQIGGAVPPDVLVGAGLGTAFAIMNNQGAEVALTLALPIAVLAQSLKVIVFILRSSFMDHAMKLAKEANIKGLRRLNLFGLFVQCFMYFIVAFIAILYGSEAVGAFVENIPQNVINGLKVAGGLLPAVGFALLLQPLLNKKNLIYFIIGFTIVTYLNLPILAVTILAIGVAFVVVYERDSNVVAIENKIENEEELFDV
ncbi:PTS sugar transporter subunit IIC [Clostridiales bacterium COT073_COT-073]|nr:PTS sugar transporter subunit IIC [Clostridiales bacterium COT073_COT-073]